MRHNLNFLKYSCDLHVFRCKAPPGYSAAGTQFPESDRKGSDLVLNCIPVANVLVYRVCGFYGLWDYFGHFGEQWIFFLKIILVLFLLERKQIVCEICLYSELLTKKARALQVCTHF